MARRAEGWKLRRPTAKSRYWSVRFRWAGQDIERSTGQTDPDRAAEEAARIYSAFVRNPPRGRAEQRPAGDLGEACEQWLTELLPTHDRGTVASYATTVESHWLRFFSGLHDVTEDRARAYMLTRLQRVRAVTVRKELSQLRNFVQWAAERGLMPPTTIPSVPKRTTGTAFSKRRRVAAPELTKAEVEALLAALPEWSTSRKVERFPVRSRFVVAYETGLRPELLDQLSVPQHYRKGWTKLVVAPEADKQRWAREVAITDRARQALDSVCPKAGLVFGAHDYRWHLRRAAEAALPPEKAEAFCGAHLRSARATHWLDAGAPLTAVQYGLGHKRLETTARYVRAQQDAHRELVRPPKKRRR